MFDISKHEGEGLDTLDKQESMPILRIIQDGSAIVKKSDPKHEEKKIEGAEAGDLVFAGQEVFKEIEVIVLHSLPSYTEWSGGKPVAQHPLTITTRSDYKARGHNPAKKNQEKLGDNVIEKTNNFFVKFRPVGEEEFRKAIIPFTSTALKTATLWSKRLLALKYDEQQAPIFSSLWKVTTTTESNDFGSWFAWQIDMVKQLDLSEDQALLEESSHERDDAKADAAQAIQAPAQQPQLESNDDPY